MSINYLCAEPGEVSRVRRRLTKEERLEKSIHKSGYKCDRAYEKLHPVTHQVLEEFKTGRDIVRKYPTYDLSNIIRICEGKANSLGGYKWRYKE